MPPTGASEGKNQDTVLGGMLLIEYDNNRIILRRANKNKLLIGPDSTGGIAVKVAKDGFDADTATAANLIFNSSQDIFKIVSKATTSIPSFATAGQKYSYVQIAHNLSITPIVQAYAQGGWVKGDTGVKNTTYIQLPFFAPVSGIGFGYLIPDITASNYYQANIIVAVDSTNITFQVEVSSSIASTTIAAIPITYFLLQETAN